MKKVIFLIALLGFLVNTEAQYSNKRSVEDFNAIEVNSTASVNLIQSDSNYVLLSYKDSAKKMPKLEVKSGVLEINSPFRGIMEVHVKNITSIKVSDAARVICRDTLKTDNLAVHVSDAGSADIWVNAKNISVKANDAADVTLGGSADTMTVKASDGSRIDATNLKAQGVFAVSSDGSNVNVWAVKSIDANTKDGSTIHIKGNPAQKSTSASDWGSLYMDDSKMQPTWDKRDGHMITYTIDSNGNEKWVKFNGDAFIGCGFVTGGTQIGAPVKYGASREFIAGAGWNNKIFKWNGVGIDFYYKSTDFFLNEDSAKTFPNKVLHQQEKISTQNFGGLLYDRFYFWKNIFLDGGIYGDWAFHSKYITWDNNTPDAASVKTIQRNLSFVNPLDYGLTFRFGSTDGISLYFNYRLSNLFQNTPVSEPAYPKMPACVIGINFGGF